ncbi:MAG TPA: zinc ribbon domain-containing protein [Anaeromyxobacteraceae bacterium]|nr:zinc ribbon domain-containing protein [Anaeromyxobacteraceae bacterium]
MTACPNCGVAIGEGASICPSCGAPAAGTPARPGATARLAFVLLALGTMGIAFVSVARDADAARPAAGALVASPVAADAPPACEPHTWVDWHIAMRRACLTPAYVCHNMTSAKLMEDPAVREAFRGALEAGRPEPIAQLDALVAHMRSRFGCDAASDEAPAPPDPGLPPGHPPVPGRPRLPPGHPPLPDDAPAPPVFEAPITVTI